MTVDSLSKPRQMTVRNRDRLLTLMTVIWILLIFVCAPFQAAGVFVFQTFAVAGMLAIIGAGMFISTNPIALGLMAIAFVANFVALSCGCIFRGRTTCTCWQAPGSSLRSLSEFWSVGRCSGQAASPITE
jgi:hypothetical protein